MVVGFYNSREILFNFFFFLQIGHGFSNESNHPPVRHHIYYDQYEIGHTASTDFLIFIIIIIFYLESISP